jgi:DNA-binding MarR family transcriptional regulator
VAAATPRTLLVEISAAYHRAGELLELALADSSLANDYALYTLLGHGGRQTPTQIASALGYPMSTTVSRVSRLVSRGHARRVRNARDARSSYVELTEEGAERWERSRVAWGDAIAVVRRHLPLPDEEATAVVGSVRDALEAAIEELLDAAAEGRAA